MKPTYIKINDDIKRVPFSPKDRPEEIGKATYEIIKNCMLRVMAMDTPNLTGNDMHSGFANLLLDDNNKLRQALENALGSINSRAKKDKIEDSDFDLERQVERLEERIELLYKEIKMIKERPVEEWLKDSIEKFTLRSEE